MDASQTALVTGASSGIGAAVAARLARAGFRTFGTRRTESGPRPTGVSMLTLDVRLSM